MTHRRKIWLWIGAGLLGLIAVVVVSMLVIVQTAWFANFVRGKLIATVEDSTGGVAQIGSLSISLRHLTLRIDDAVLHGKEPAGQDPLLRIKQLELKVQLFTGIKKPFNVEYLGILQPQVNLLLLPDGTTNVPEPKNASPPSQTSGLETVVDLAVNHFNLQNGLIKVLQAKTRLNLRGDNLRALLNYDVSKTGYVGNLAMDPLMVTSDGQPPLDLHVNLPLVLQKDAIRTDHATITSAHSQLQITAALANMQTPVVSANLNASLSLPEMQRSFALPIDTSARDVPQILKADLAVRYNDTTSQIQVSTAKLVLGNTTFQANGTLGPSTKTPLRFNLDFALAQLAQLLKVTSVQVRGNLSAEGQATLDKQNKYNVNGSLQSRQLSVRSGTTAVSDVNVSSPFHADPYLISLDGFRVNVLGGSLRAKLFLEKLQNLSVEGHLQNFSIPVLVTALSGKQLGYDGALDGTIVAKGDLKAKGTTGYSAQANLVVIPGRRKVPISGQIDAKYSGTTGALNLGNSYLRLPNSRLDLNGSLDRRINIDLTSRNLNDFLPAVNFGAAKPQVALPVQLSGGTAELKAQITGNTAAPHITARLNANEFLVEQRPFRQLGLDLGATQSGVTIQNGALTGQGFNVSFDASLGLRKWAP